MKTPRAWMQLVTVVCCAALTACGKNPPEPPVVNPPAPGETITGSERIGWDQIAADTTELAAIRYAIYVDNARSELTGVACTPSSGTGPFACAARLPPLAPGPHTLALASFVVDGTVLESASSAPLRVVVIAATAPGAQTRAMSAPVTPSRGEAISTTLDGVRLRFEVVAEGIDDPVDLAFAPDGRVFVAERGGAIRVLKANLSPERPPARDVLVEDARLLAIAVDPQFERNHFVYALAAVTAGGRPTFSLARFREASNTFADRVVLLDGIPARADDPAAALRFGPDATLFAAFDDAGDPAAAADLGLRNGKMLRLDTDGSTPADQANASPLHAFGFHAPEAIAWQPGPDLVWVAERAGTLTAVEIERTPDRQTRGVTGRTYAMPARVAPRAIAFHHGHLLVASDAGLLRIRFDAARPAVALGTDHLLTNELGPIRTVGVGIDGTIYVATNDAIGRLVR